MVALHVPADTDLAAVKQPTASAAYSINPCVIDFGTET
jgi:hypothetical protein